jgi:hypothetical protein
MSCASLVRAANKGLKLSNNDAETKTPAGMLALLGKGTAISSTYNMLEVTLCQGKNGLGCRPPYKAERCDATARHLPFCWMKVSVKIIVAVSGWPLKFPTCAALPITTAASP